MGDSDTTSDGDEPVGSRRSNDRGLDPDFMRRAAGLGRESTAVWLAMAKRWTERSKTDTQWKPEDVMVDATDLFEHLTPIVKESFEVWIDFLRPWAVQIEAQTVKGSDDE